jgi:Ni,Fe-hydrogenase III large subunit/Ni,Fe-hydrogenase III component G
MEPPDHAFDSPGPVNAHLDLDRSQLVATVERLFVGGYRLALVAAHHDPDRSFRVVYLFTSGPPDRRVEIRVRLDPRQPSVPSLAAMSFPANRFEREMHDLFGIEAEGHHAPHRLVLHQHWPEGWCPMRVDAGPPPPMVDTGEPYPFVPVEGPGVYEIPVGPVHAGVIEPGHFRFFAVGETILRMKARLWFVHKGIEALFAGRTLDAGIELAERISGDTAVGHNLAYCLAVEDASQIEIPRPAQLLRAMLLEMERLYNHVADLGALCNDVGYGILNAQALRIREQLLRINAQTTGHRLLRGGISPGGAAVANLPRATDFDHLAIDVGEVVELALANSTVLDRFTGTGVLGTADAREIGVLGYVARASGVTSDARTAHPFVDLASHLEIPSRQSGDVLARFLARAEELQTSARLLAAILEELDGETNPPTVPVPRSDGVVSGVGIVEGWRGTIVHRVEINPDATVSRLKVVDPSFMNWPALPIALAGTIVPDFPLINKSFNQSYAGNDL